ncbi:stage III sporulation protein AA [Thermoclostridium caenicola]|uniref:Stage III sporulation protein AA n=1 Tax=Thermoclostridium caenicola TaxID=659425 RepID=A0A1M6C964_9FIRM|nr:stage III sporulation protein AA [Thermoclostridium caenicola]SHI57535.1 stage III sporulation protein AA [Thermoclostridium caenicola]HOP71694.1 stage III sporulation protein AA [Thermoclostridium caenicola]
MEKVRHLHALDRISSYLPDRLKRVVSRMDPGKAAGLEELRINAEMPLVGVFSGFDCFIAADGSFTCRHDQAFRVGREEVEELFYRLCEHSVYAYQDDIARGFLTLKGGYRAGICGKAVYQGQTLKGFKDISSICIRIPRELKGCAEPIFPFIRAGRHDICNTLVISPPRCGKTTLLRDLCRIISTGSEAADFAGLRTVIVDERSEIAACYRGVPQNDCGPRTDVLDGCRKAEGIEMALRGLSPAVIVVDELGTGQDAESIKMAWNAGARIVATAHAYDINDLRERLGFGILIGEGGFERYIVLGIRNGSRWVKVSDAYGNRLYSDQAFRMPDGVFRVHSHGAEMFREAESQAACTSEVQGHPAVPGERDVRNGETVEQGF